MRLRTVALPGSVKFNKPGAPAADGKAGADVGLEVELSETDAVNEALAALSVAEAVGETRDDNGSVVVDKTVELSVEKVEETTEGLSELFTLGVLVGRPAVRGKDPDAMMAIHAEGTFVGIMKADGSGGRKPSVTVTVTGS